MGGSVCFVMPFDLIALELFVILNPFPTTKGFSVSVSPNCSVCML